MSLPKTRLTAFIYADVKPDTVLCLAGTARMWPELDMDYEGNDALIDRARSRAASRFLLETDAEVLVMVDHDMAWRAGDLERLAQSCAKTRSIVGGVYPKRAMGMSPPIRFAGPGQYQIGSDELAEVTYISTGFMAIHRDVLEKLKEDLPFTMGGFWPFFMPVLEGEGAFTEELSEDWAICRRAIGAGFTLWADLKPDLKHIGDYTYRLIDSYPEALTPDRFIRINVDDVKEDEESFKTLVEHVSKFTRVPIQALERGVHEARQYMVDRWEGFDKEEEYYTSEGIGRAYILDLLHWHIWGGVFKQVMNQIGDVDENTRILDYGAGIGTVALELARTSKHVHAVEINKTMRDFMAWRAQELAVPFQIHPATKNVLPEEKFDLIICWHVLEHLPEQEQEAVVNWIADHLAEGGRLVTQSDFHQDSVHPYHHMREDNGDGLWEEAGFHRVEGDVWERAAIMAATGG